MRINELIGVKKQLAAIKQNVDSTDDGDYSPESPPYDSDFSDLDHGNDNRTRTYKDVLVQQGFRKLGSGGYASVWGHPKLNYVLKIFDNSDIGYLNWVNTCMKNKGISNLPKFISAKPVNIINEFYAVRMEKLIPITFKDQEFVLAIKDMDRLMEEIWNDKESIPSLKDLESHIPENYPNLYKIWKSSNPDIIKTLWLIISMIKDKKIVYHDFYNRNFMQRGNTLVFTDPVI